LARGGRRAGRARRAATGGGAERGAEQGGRRLGVQGAEERTLGVEGGQQRVVLQVAQSAQVRQRTATDKNGVKSKKTQSNPNEIESNPTRVQIKAH